MGLRNRWVLETDGSSKQMDDSDAFLERMHRFVALYRGELGDRFPEVERIDLRYASGVAVAFQPEEQVAGVAGE